MGEGRNKVSRLPCYPIPHTADATELLFEKCYLSHVLLKIHTQEDLKNLKGLEKKAVLAQKQYARSWNKRDSKKLYKVRRISAFSSSKAAFDHILRTEMIKTSKNWGVPRRLQKAIENAQMALVGQTEYFCSPRAPDFSSLFSLLQFPFRKPYMVPSTWLAGTWSSVWTLVACISSRCPSCSLCGLSLWRGSKLTETKKQVFHILGASPLVSVQLCLQMVLMDVAPLLGYLQSLKKS